MMNHMYLYEKEIEIPREPDEQPLIDYFRKQIFAQLEPYEVPIRFVVTKTTETDYACELGVLSQFHEFGQIKRETIFDYQKRLSMNADDFNAILLVPTGIGSEVGGHSGDAGPVARLLASMCDHLITHPNVVNASDINELPENGLYVEGSLISRLMMGTVGLQKVPSNRVVVFIEKHEDSYFHEQAINAVSAARAALGLDCPKVVLLEEHVKMQALYSQSGRAVGQINQLEPFLKILEDDRDQYDAVAIASIIRVQPELHVNYFKEEDIINPWGGVEAMLTHTIATLFDVPAAHSGVTASREIFSLEHGLVDPRKAAEVVSITFLHCVLKGLSRSPRIVPLTPGIASKNILDVSDISCLIVPDGCVGIPVLAAIEQGIPVIAVRENKNRMQNSLQDLPFQPGKFFMVDNYLEAAGVMSALKAGVSLETVCRPLEDTKIEVSRSTSSIIV